MRLGSISLGINWKRAAYTREGVPRLTLGMIFHFFTPHNLVGWVVWVFLWVRYGRCPRYTHVSAEYGGAVYEIGFNCRSRWIPEAVYRDEMKPHTEVHIPVDESLVLLDHMDRACPKGIRLNLRETLHHQWTGKPSIPDNCIGMTKRLAFCCRVTVTGRTPDEIFTSVTSHPDARIA